ncbi:DUF5801 repeats-in-toxin domain-containing protein [Pararhizobium sp. DWP3-4]|uniref:T1SS-143 repeat domain-containing protein n=1 Tax=Pararhizobium sp. DWP3-4 TaxID=2804565 RepID=UPI003CF89BC4
MSIEDLNISAIDADQSASEFSLEFQDDGRQATDIEMAQATENGASSKSARLPAEVAAAGERPKEIVPDQNNIARLPADVTVDEIRVDGANLILVQADGTEVTIVNGALRIPTFIIGDVEIPQQVLLAVLEQDGVNVAAGPDGSYSATGSGPQSSGGNFEDTLQQSTQEAGPLADLLANTEFGDPNGDGNGLLFDDTPIITETALSFITETANADGTFENQTIDGIFGFVPGADTGQIASIAYVNTLNIDEPTQTGFATALTSGGAAVVVTVSADGLTLTGTAGGAVVFTLTVTNTATGAFTFQQLHALDHPDQGQSGADDLLRLQFTYTVTDKDGDTVIGNASIDIRDDGPVANVGTGSTVEDESVNGGNNEADGFTAGISGVSLNINWGADSANLGGANDRSVAFTNTTVAVSGAHGATLTSLGLTVSTVLVNGVLVGYTGDTAPTAITGEGSSNVVFYAKVSDVANGSYDFTLVKPLDHAAGDGANGENSLSLTFNYTATDSDGDKSNNTFTVNVVDDVPVANVGTASTVEDEAVNGGNNEDDDFSAAVTGVSLNINWGADNANASGLNDRSVAFTNATVAVSGASSTALTSLGLAVTTTVFPDGTLVGYTGPTAPTALTGEGSGNLVFFAKVSDVANGSYDFTLVKPLDHAAGDGANGENSLSLTFNYTATDSDGDKSNNTFTVNVVDDVPVANVGTASTVEDEAVNGGNNEDDDFSAAVTGVSLNINWGADNANASGLNDRSVAFTNATVAVSGASSTALTSLGLAVTTTVLPDGTLVGYTGPTAPTALTGEGSGNLVFFAKVSDVANGSYDFTLVKPLDHAAGDGANGENSLSLTFNYTATDSDGDKSNNTFTVNVIDDGPVRGDEVRGTAEDEAVNGGNNESDGLTAVATGALNIRWGADNADSDLGGNGDRSVAFTATNNTPAVVVSGAHGATLTSLGLAVTMTVLSNGVLVGYTGAQVPAGINGANVVFYASLSDDNSGAYTFTLVKPLDHAAGDGTNGQNNLSLTFGYTAKDSDGDSVTGSFTVDVSDDVAEIYTPFAGGVVEEEQLQVAGSGNEDGSGSGDNDWFLDANSTTHKTGGTLAISWGSDNSNDGNGQPGDRSVQFGPAAVGNLSTLNLTSDGDSISYITLTVSGQQILLAYTGATAPTAVPANSAAALAANIVFSVALSDVGNGSYAFTLYDTLDHQGLAQGEDGQILTFQFTATDSDGDTTPPKTFSVSVSDDTPVAIGTILPRFVEEEELSGGNEDTRSGTPFADLDGILGNVTGKSAGGPLNIFWGGDDGNTRVNGGYTGSQVAGDLSVVFADGTGAARALTATQAGEFLSISGGAGSVALGSLTSAGQPVTFSLSANGTVLTASAGGQTVFTVTLSDTGRGSYDFNLTGVLDHPVKASGASNEDVLSFTFTFTARDGDGDIAKDTFKVGVIDDAPVVTGTSIGVTVDEDDIRNLRSEGTSPNDGTADGSSSELALLGGGFAATVSGSVASTVAFGANGQQAGGGFSFTSDALATLNGLGLTSKGGTVVFAFVGDAIVGYVNGYFGGFQPLVDRPVMSLELNETTGAFTFRQYDQLDHAAGNGQNTALANGLASINFGAVINATDGDGDVVNLSGKLLITVRDDVPEVSISTVGSVTIDETSGNQNDDTTSNSARNLFNGVTNKGWDSDLGGAIYARHDVVDTSVNGGTDDTVTTSLTLRIDSSTSGLFTTDGQAITLSMQGDMVVGRIASGAAAFAVAIQPNGDVSVAQYMSLAHPNTGSNDEAINLAGKISAVITATDHDGDVIEKLVSIGTKISFDDDGPRVFANTLVQIDEDLLSGGNPGGDGDDINGAALTGTLAHDSGADGTASVLWSSAGLTLPSGFWFSVSTDGTVMTITQLQGGVYVPVVTATITNTATGAYSVGQVAPIDHPQGTIPGFEDNVQFTISYDVADGDGDQARGTLSINVDDDTPTVAASAVIALDDDALSGGNPGGAGDDAENSILTGVLSHSGGGDGTASVLWAPNGLTLPNGFWYDLSADSKTMTITQLQNSAYVGVFKVVVTDPATGAYQVTQLAAVKHNTVGAEDNLQVSFQYRVTDGDGDVATGTLTLNVDDDTPTLTQTLRYNDVYEAGVGAASGTDNSTFAVTYGADGYGATAFTGALKLDIGGGLAGNVNLNLANGSDSSPKFTSEGRVVVFTMVDANTIRGFAGNELIIEIKLTDTDSSAKTTLYGNIDHIAAQNGAAIDRLVVDATVKFTDGDGDAVTGIIRSTIHDEAPVAIGAAQTGTLSEAGLPLVSSTFASLNIDIGADNKGTHVSIGMSGGVPIINAGLTSDGVPLQYIVRTTNGVDEELVAFKQGDTAANPVFIVAVLHPGSFAATLYQNVDHVGGNDATLALNMVARVYDGDGDFVDQPFTINIADSVPTLTQTLRYNDVYEAGVGAASGTDNSTFAVTYGADGYGATAFTGALKLDIGGGLAGNVNLNLANGSDSSPKFTSEGRVVVFTMVDANTIRGFAGNELIIEIKLTDTDSSAKTTLYGNIDHIAAQNGAAIDRLVIDATVKFTDGDGDAVTGIIRSTIHDEAPVASDLTAVMTENESKSVTLVEGVHFNFGADEFGKAFSFGTPSYTGIPNGITLGTPAITFDTAHHQISIVPGTAFDVLAAGQTVVLHIPYTVADGDGDSVTKKIALTITGTNDIPVIDLNTETAGNDTTTNAVEQLPQQFAWQADLSDVDSSNLQSMELTLGNIQDATAETLSLNATATTAAAGLTVSYDGTTGVMLITGSASVSRYETILKNIIYLNGSDNPDVALDRTVTVIVNDGLADSAPQVATIHLIAINDAPVLGGTLTETVAEGGGVVLTLAKLGYIDVDDNNTGVTFLVSNLAHGTITNGGASATSFTAAEVFAGLIKFNHDGSEGSTASFNVKVEDGNEDGSVPAIGTFNLAVSPVNDAPAITGDRTLAVNEGATVTLTTTDLGFSDPDDVGLGVTFTVTNPLYGGVLVNGATALSFNGQQLLDGQVSFQHNGSETTAASFGVILEDGNEDNSAPETATVNVIVVPVNDAPVLSGLGNVTFSENVVNAGPQLIDNDVSLTDDDSANFSGGSLTASWSAGGASQDQLSFLSQGNSAGQISISGNNIAFGGAQIGTISSNGANGASLVVNFNASATPLAVDALVQRLAYANNSDTPNLTRTLSITVSDGDGGASTAVTSTVTVNPQADALGTVLGKNAIVSGLVSDSGVFNGPDPAKSNYWTFYAHQGAVVTLDVDRTENAFDPAMWLFAGKVSSAAVFGSALDTNDPGFIAFADDTDDHNGPHGDPRISFTAPVSGFYTAIVTNYASGSSGDNLFSYNLKISGNSNAPVGTDPIILDLDLNGFALTSIENGVTFDINADGKADKVAWTSADGILAYDLDGNGKIDNGTEIFTPSFAGGNHAGGVAALATLDSNGDGKIDADDNAFSKLSIWIDANNNGISDGGELSSLADNHVASISLGATSVDGLEDGQSVVAEGTFTLDNGSNGHFIEVGFDTIVGDGSFGTAGDDILAGGLAQMTMTGGAGADTFVLDSDSFKGIDLADVITDYKAGEGDVLDVSSLLTSLLGHDASEADALASVKTTVNGADTVVSVNDNGAWHDVAVLQDYTSTVKVLYDDDHNSTAVSHAV